MREGEMRYFVPETLCESETAAEEKPAEEKPAEEKPAEEKPAERMSPGSAARTTLGGVINSSVGVINSSVGVINSSVGVINSSVGVIRRQIALRRYAPHLTRAHTFLHLAAGEMDDIRTRAELYYATSEEDWQDGPEGRAYLAVLAELRLEATALRETALPDVGSLR